MLVACRTIAVHLDDDAAIVAGRSLTIAGLIQQRQTARKQHEPLPEDADCREGAMKGNLSFSLY